MTLDIPENEPAGGTQEWEDKREDREQEAMELLYGKKIGDRMVYQDSKGNIDTDWRLTQIEEDGKTGETKALLSREGQGDMAKIRSINFDKIKGYNFQNSEEIVDELSANIRKAENYPMLGENKGRQGSREGAIKESEEMLSDFMEGNFESTKKYYAGQLKETGRAANERLEIFEEAEEELIRAKEAVQSVSTDDDLGYLKSDITKAENYYHNSSQELQRVRAEVAKLESIADILSSRIEE